MGNPQSKSGTAHLEQLKQLAEKAQSSNYNITENESKILAKVLRNSKPIKKLWAANTISFLTKDNNENRNTLGKTKGIIKGLLQMLHKLKLSDMAQIWALCALGNLCLDNADNQKRVAYETYSRQPGLTTITHRLSFPNEDIQRWAANTIGILCTNNMPIQETFGDIGGIPLLMKCLHSQKYQVAKWATFASGYVAELKKNRPIMVKHDALDGLVKILRYSISNENIDGETRRWAANVIATLCYEHPEHRVSLGRQRGLEILLLLLKRHVHNVLNSTKSKKRGSGHVNNNTTGSPRSSLHAQINPSHMYSSDLEKLSQSFQNMKAAREQLHDSTADENGSDEKIVKNVSQAIANACIDNPENQKEAIELGALDIFVSIIKSQDKLFYNSKGEAKHWVAMAIYCIGKNYAEIPDQLKKVMDTAEVSTKSMLGRKIVDLIDKSSTVAMRLIKQVPSAQQLFEMGMDLDNEDGSDDEAEKRKSVENLNPQSGVEHGTHEEESDENFYVQYSDLQIDYEDMIGKGGFSNVYKGTFRGNTVAVKEMLGFDNEFVRNLILREINSLRNCRHENIVKLLAVCDADEGLFLVTEMVHGGDLRQLLKNSNVVLDAKTKLSITYDITKAVNYLHSNALLHRDLKSKNVLIVPNTNKAILCDFGFAREHTHDVRSATPLTIKVGTDEWMSPEVLLGEEYDFSADVWSFGNVMYEIITRRKAIKRLPKNFYYYEKTKEGTSTEFQDGLIEMAKSTFGSDEEMPKGFVELAVQCVQREPEKRPTFFQILTTLEVLISNSKK